MAKASPFLASSNAGEFSPRMDARVDFDKYGAAVSRGTNLICLPQGGITARPGTRFIKEKRGSLSQAALMPFEPVSGRAYMVEIGDGYMQFYRNQGQLVAPAINSVILNGSFDTGITGWSDISTGGTATISWNAAGKALSLNGAANGFSIAQQGVSIDALYVNVVHVIKFQISGNPGGKATVQIGTTSGGAELLTARNLGLGWHALGVTPGVTSIWLQFINEGADVLLIDTVSLLNNSPLDLSSPYPAAVVNELRWAQTGDVKYIFHSSYQPYKLERRGDLSWSMTKVFFSDGPWLGLNPDTDLSATNLIKNSTFDGGLANWGQAVTGNGFVNYESTSNAVLLQVSKDGASTGRVSQAVVTGASAAVHVLHFQIVGGGTVTLALGTTDGGTEISAVGAFSAGWYDVEFTPGASTFYVAFSASNAVATIAGGVSAAFCYTTNARLIQPSALTGAITVTALGNFKPFAATDVGRSIRFEDPGQEPGWGVIIGFTNSQSVSVYLYRDLRSNRPLESWRLGAWSDTTGWPHVGTFYQQRLFAANTALQSQTMWGSQSGDFENMRPDSWVQGAKTVHDSDALNFTLASGVSSPIVWMLGSRRLVVGTGAGQWAISSKGAALTPSDFSADPQTSVRALDAQPAQIDTVGLFIQRAKRGLYDLSYSFQVDSFTSSDVTILSDHITKGNLAQIVYQAEPFSNVWSRLETGTLAIMTYKRSQNVVGWTTAAIAGSVAGAAVVESVATIPGSDDSSQVYSSVNRDELWMIVKRTINGLTKRYIEIMEGYFDGPNRALYLNKSEWKTDMRTAQADAFYVDCGLTYSGALATVISGLSHLEGETVKVFADGAQQADQTVSGGSITLDLAASKVHVGLGYNWIYRGMKLPYGSQTGPGVGQTKNINGIAIVLRDASSFQYAIDLAGVGDEETGDLTFSDISFRSPADPMSQAVPLFSGEWALDAPDGSGFSTDPRLVMMGSGPWTLLGVSPRLVESEL